MFEKVNVESKANIYFDGKVTSVRFIWRTAKMLRWALC